MPNRGKVDPGPVIAVARARRKQFNLPVLDPRHPHRLWFLPWEARTRLQSNRFGLPEPVMSRGQRLSPRHMDLVLTPWCVSTARAIA